MMSRHDDGNGGGGGGGGGGSANNNNGTTSRGTTTNPLADARRGGRGGRPRPRGACRDPPWAQQQPPPEKVGSGGTAGLDVDVAFAKERKSNTDKKKGRAGKANALAPRASSASDALLESLWHKKTNGGYRLFASYYLNQPAGIVAGADAADATTTAQAAESILHMAPGAKKEEEEVVVVVVGRSRASLRRRRSNDRKKKRQRVDGDAASQQDAATGPPLALERSGAEDGDNTKRARANDAAAAAWEEDPRGASRTKGAAGDSAAGASRRRQTDGTDPHPLIKALRDVTASGEEEEGAVGRRRHNDGNGNGGARHFDWFVRALARPLPVSFRIRRGMDPRQEALLRSELQQFVEAAVLRPVPGLGVASDGETADDFVIPPQVYQTPTTTSTSDSKDAASSMLTKSNLKVTCPELKMFLNEWSLKGGIARQEVGSMLPVLLLQAAGFLPGSTKDVHLAAAISNKSIGGIRVLDLCASPGSKTLQAAELLLMLPAKCRSRTVIRANDVHPKRLEALQDAVMRSGIPNVDSIIKYSQIDATQFPVPASESKKYDVVICDVPCSGDGTCRKDRHLLPNWTPRIGTALHATQLGILARALQLVRIGGAVSYSTCSLNPVENEAVVAAALQQATVMAATNTTGTNNNRPPKYELVQLPILENFVLRPGVSTWRVAESVSLESDESEGAVLRWHETYEDAIKAGMEDAVPSLWPLTPEACPVAQHLDRCRRLLPQDQDTGGFFVALIQRVS